MNLAKARTKLLAALSQSDLEIHEPLKKRVVRSDHHAPEERQE